MMAAAMTASLGRHGPGEHVLKEICLDPRPHLGEADLVHEAHHELPHTGNFAETHGQPDGHGGAPAHLAGEVDGAPVLIDDLAHEDHAQAGAAHFGGKVGLEDAVQHLGGHAPAGVLDHQGGVGGSALVDTWISPWGEVASMALRTRWAMATLRRCLFIWVKAGWG